MTTESAATDPDRGYADSAHSKTPGVIFEHKPPALFTGSAVLSVYLYTLTLVLPLVLALAAMTLLKPSILTLLIPLVTLVATAYILPFGLGNAFLRRLAAKINPALAADPNSFIVQITLRPRLRSAFRGLIEDADDIGILSLNPQSLEFIGDSLRITLPYAAISEVGSHNVGIRGRFLYGSRTRITTTALSSCQAIEFSERSSLVLPESKRISRALTKRVMASALPAGGS
jgi:hypothetical protein